MSGSAAPPNVVNIPNGIAPFFSDITASFHHFDHGGTRNHFLFLAAPAWVQMRTVPRRIDVFQGSLAKTIFSSI
jgi:hypothetical protein